MNVVLIHESFASPTDPGGTRHYELATHLVGRGHTFTAITSDTSYLTGRALTARDAIPAGLNVVRVRVPAAHHRWLGLRVVGFVTFAAAAVWRGLRLRRAPDVVLGTTPSPPQAFAAWLIAALRRRPFVLEVRDLWPAFPVGMGALRNRGLIWLLVRLERFLYGRATLVIVNSPAYAPHLVASGVPAERIRVVPNGVNASAYDPESRGSAVRDELGLSEEFVVIYAGALGQANDIPTLLRAGALLKAERHIQLVLVGDGRERPRLERMARAMQLDNVTFAGAHAKQRMPEVLAAADACIAILQGIPAFRTTYPNKVFDYMAAGRPVILAIDGAIREFIERAGGGVFVPPEDPAALAAAILRASHDPEGCRRMGLAGRAYVEAHCDRGRQARLFEEAISQAQGGGSTT